MISREIVILIQILSNKIKKNIFVVFHEQAITHTDWSGNGFPCSSKQVQNWI